MYSTYRAWVLSLPDESIFTWMRILLALAITLGVCTILHVVLCEILPLPVLVGVKSAFTLLFFLVVMELPIQRLQFTEIGKVWMFSFSLFGFIALSPALAWLLVPVHGRWLIAMFVVWVFAALLICNP